MQIQRLRSIIYSIVRTESGFDERDMSSAKAVGLMQVTPVAGRDTAKRLGVTYGPERAGATATSAGRPRVGRDGPADAVFRPGPVSDSPPKLAPPGAVFPGFRALGFVQSWISNDPTESKLILSEPVTGTALVYAA